MQRPAARRSRSFAALAALLALATAATLAALGSGAASAAPLSASDAGWPGVPKLTWTACSTGFECATAKVPLDYSRPGAASISLALIRLPATDRAHRIGSLFVNPGGPGGSGVDFVQQAAALVYSDAVRARFDIVGFDPRFIGASRPLATCATNDEYLALYGGIPSFPITRAQEAAAHAVNAKYDALCAQRAPFLAYASTANVARDLDLLRQGVGDQKLNYVGYSYGSQLGQTYAALFPDRIRSLTIDGVLDGQAWSTGTPWQSHRVPFTARIGSAAGAYDTFTQFTRLCDRAGPAGCLFATGGHARVKYDKLAARLRKVPLAFPDGSELGYADLVSGTLGALYSPTEWPYLAQSLQALYDSAFPPPAGSAAAAASAAKASAAAGALRAQASTATRWLAPGASPASIPPIDVGLAPFVAVTCSDTVNPHSEQAWAAAGAAQDRIAPYFGRSWTWAGENCAAWSLPGIGRYLGPYNRATSAPVLVVGTLHDPATAYSGALAVAHRIPGARLLTIDGYGHTSLAAPSACASAAFDAYLISGQLPAKGTVCTQDVVPFPAA